MNPLFSSSLSLVSLFSIGFVSHSQAATITWDGSSNNNWRKDANWTNGGTPTASDIAIFPAGESRNSVDLSDSSNNDTGRVAKQAFFVTDDANNTTDSGIEVDWYLKNGTLDLAGISWQNLGSGNNVRLDANFITTGGIHMFADSGSDHTLDFYGDFLGSGTILLSSNGPVALHSAQSYTGKLRLISNNSKLAVRNNAALTNATVDMDHQGSILDLSGYSPTLGSLKGGFGSSDGKLAKYAIAIDAGRTLTVGSKGADNTFKGFFSGAGGLTYSATNNSDVWSLSTQNNIHTGATTINKGVLALVNNSSLENSVVTINANGTLRCSTATSLGNLKGTGALEVSDSVSVGDEGNILAAFTGVLSGDGSLTINAGGHSISGVSGNYDGAVFLDGGSTSFGATRFQLSDVTVSSDFALDLVLATTIGGLAGNGDIILDGNLILGSVNSDLTYSGDLTDDGTLTKNGTGIWSFNGTKAGSGTVTINAGTLGGTGTISGNTTIASAAAIAPGNSAGTLTFNDDLDINGDFEVEIDGVTVDLVAVTGTLDITGSDLILSSIGSGATEPVYIIANYGALTGPFGTITGLPSGYYIDYAYNDGASTQNIALVLDVTPPTLDSLALDGSLSSPTAADTLLFNVSFSETVTGVDASDFLIGFTGGNGTPTLTGSGTAYILTIPSVTGDAILTLTLPAGSGIVDTAGNALEATSLSAAVTIDNTAPQVTLTKTESSPSNANSISYTIVFDEPVTGLVNFSDFYITGTTDAITDISATTIVDSGDGKNYTLILHTISGDGFLQFRLRASQIADLAGNHLSADPFAPGITIDNTAPVIELNGDGASVSLVVGASWSDPVTATDTVNLIAISVAVITAGDTVDTASAGSYAVTYDATDAAGNAATQLSRTVTVISTYDDWAASNGLTGADALPSADPNGDGKTNLEKFALDGDPLDGGNDGKVVGEVATVSSSEYLVLTLPVRSGASFSGATSQTATLDGINYTIESSLNLSSWTGSVIEVSPALDSAMPALSSGWEYRSFRFHQSTQTINRVFMRITINEAP